MSQSSKLLLAVNCGSSSIKFKLFSLPGLEALVSGSAGNVALKGLKAKLSVTEQDQTLKEEVDEGVECKCPITLVGYYLNSFADDDVFERLVELLEKTGPLAAHGRSAIEFVTHRVVHGGTQSEPIVIYKGHLEGLGLIDKLSRFAPLHNHRAITTVHSCLKHMPEAKQVLCFDTLFHSTIPKHVYTYPIEPPKEPTLIPLRKYGMHGLSYASILRDVAAHLGKKEEDCNLVIAHLGSGASVCLIQNGKSVDTSMGVTPLEGLPGGTRSGSVDPVLIFHHTPDAAEIIAQGDSHVTRAELVMNKQGGLQALAGTSDFGQILSRLDANPPDEPAELAYAVFIDRVLNFVGAYLVKALGRAQGASIDGLVFSGGIGERSIRLRAEVGGYLRAFGGEVDPSRNESKNSEGTVRRISTDASKIGIFVCETDEEQQCARMARDWAAKNQS